MELLSAAADIVGLFGGVAICAKALYDFLINRKDDDDDDKSDGEEKSEPSSDRDAAE